MLETQAEVDPLEVLEFEHRIESALPDGGDEADVDRAGIELRDQVQVVQDAALLEPDGAPVDTGARGVDCVILAGVELVAGVGADRSPGRLEVLGEDDEVAVEVTVTLAHIRSSILAAAGTGGRITDADDKAGDPVQAEIAFAQECDTTGEMPILVNHNQVAGGRIRAALAIEDGTNISEFHAIPERNIDTILESRIAPTSRRQRMLVQIVGREHKRSVGQDLPRRHLQETRAAVCELRPHRRSAKQEQERCQYDGLYCLSFHLLSFRTNSSTPRGMQ